MSNAKWLTIAGGLFLAVVMAGGCGPKENAAPAGPAKIGGGPAEHAHPTAGPHKGDLIELGNEEYHAEFVHDETGGTVTIYILDAQAKTAVPIDAAELLINLKHDGQAEQFKLAASPDASDPQGKSSRFISKEAELGEDLEHEGAEPQLVVEINGKQYRGKIEHAHEEGAHKH